MRPAGRVTSPAPLAMRRARSAPCSTAVLGQSITGSFSLLVCCVQCVSRRPPGEYLLQRHISLESERMMYHTSLHQHSSRGAREHPTASTHCVLDGASRKSVAYRNQAGTYRIGTPMPLGLNITHNSPVNVAYRALAAINKEKPPCLHKRCISYEKPRPLGRGSGSCPRRLAAGFSPLRVYPVHP